AFSVITALHLVIGELAPKTFAIRQPERLALWCAVPLKWFYILSYPLLVALTTVTIALLKAMRIDGTTDHESAHSEEEIRWLLSHARTHGELTRSEHKLLNAVFEFDETICRQVMVPRVEVVFVDVDAPLGDAIRQARSSRHTRYPVCHGSLDKVLGVVHIKDLTGVSESDEIDLRKLMRPPRFVPETMPISRLLGHFQATRQHMAFVLDEYGTVLGIVTLENVIETIVGPVEDEFDLETPDVVPDGPGRFLVQGGTLLAVVNRKLGLTVFSHEVDTIAGLVMDRLGRIPQVGDTVDLDGATAEVLEVRGARATTLRLAVGTDDAGTGEGGRRPA
ncbi:MAG: hemolysin family protein, partial [Acidobacteriota bacterium]|nr:hemolysin family protein [Acidobacteriota bacterium]